VTLELAGLAGVASPGGASLKQWQRRILNQRDWRESFSANFELRPTGDLF